MSQTDIEASIEAEVESQSSQEAEIKEEKEFCLSEKIKQWCESTTIHAIPQIVHKDNVFLKIMWFLFLIVFVGKKMMI
jgi:hypothetical protein